MKKDEFKEKLLNKNINCFVKEQTILLYFSYQSFYFHILAIYKFWSGPSKVDNIFTHILTLTKQHLMARLANYKKIK